MSHPPQPNPPSPTPSQKKNPPPPPIELDSEMEYKVSKILDSKLDRHFKAGNVLHYLVCWTGYKGDRKSTRLNSSHQIISYAVFCLKKKKNIKKNSNNIKYNEIVTRFTV